MRIQVSSLRHILGFSALITLLAVAVPVVIIGTALWHAPGRVFWSGVGVAALIPLFIAFPISVFGLLLLKKITDALRALDKLMKFDPLTGVMSRSQFFHQAHQQRNGGGYLAIVDADHFKTINDTHGHEAGDEVLRTLAGAMSQAVGQAGFVARLGGEEFGIYLPRVNREQALMAMASVATVVRSSAVNYMGTEIGATVSIGLAPDAPQIPITSAFRRADACLYRAKAQGRDRCVIDDRLDEALASAA